MLLFLKLNNFNHNLSSGFGLVETIVAVAIFITFAASSIFGVLGSFTLNRLGNENTQATLLAQEGIDATRSIKKQNWSNLTPGSYGLNGTGSSWVFTGTSQTINKFTRTINIALASRDTGGSLVSVGGTTDPDTFLVSSNVSWDFTTTRHNSVGITTYLTNWEKPIATLNLGGLLVYGNGGANSDSVMYRVLNGVNGTWSAPAAVADIDSTSSNRALRAARVYASATRNEKILLSRHIAGTSQYIYGQVYNGATWVNVNLMASWTASTYTDVQNFDGAYLSNGDFVIVYSDNTTTPKMRYWNGTVWSSQISTQNIGGVPSSIVVKSRAGTNEIMATFFDQSSDTNTQYFTGGAYQTSSWILHPEHSATAPSAAKSMIDFAWSPNTTTKGVLIYAASSSDKTITSKVWTANGSGSGSWSVAVDSAASGGNMGAMNIEGRSTANHFLACQKNANSDLYCFKFDISAFWSSPANNILTLTNYSGNPRSYHLGFEKSGSLGLVTYSDNTSTPKYRKYNPSSNSFDPTASSLSATTGNITTVRQIPHPQSDDIMVLLANAALDVYSVVWDGTNNAFYSTGGRSQTQQGVSGSNVNGFWYDFVWDAN